MRYELTDYASAASGEQDARRVPRGQLTCPFLDRIQRTMSFQEDHASSPGHTTSQPIGMTESKRKRSFVAKKSATRTLGYAEPVNPLSASERIPRIEYFGRRRVL